MNSDPDGVDFGLESQPLLAFAVCFVIAKFTLDVVDQERVEAILNNCEEHQEEL
jgi:hypothetical protein